MPFSTNLGKWKKREKRAGVTFPAGPREHFEGHWKWAQWRRKGKIRGKKKRKDTRPENLPDHQPRGRGVREVIFFFLGGGGAGGGPFFLFLSNHKFPFAAKDRIWETTTSVRIRWGGRKKKFTKTRRWSARIQCRGKRKKKKCVLSGGKGWRVMNFSFSGNSKRKKKKKKKGGKDRRATRP